MDGFSQVSEGLEYWEARCIVSRHIHRDAYVAVILSGGYEECGSRGRFRVGPGDVLVHDGFDSHLNRFQSRGTRILNLRTSGLTAPFGRVADPDAVARAAERHPAEAACQLQAQFQPTLHAPADWPDLLAHEILHDSDRSFEDWAIRHGLRAETVSRGFRKVFGLTPARFRLEARTRRAMTLITGSTIPLADVAACTGFADQAHLSRSVRTLTGKPPCAWRRSIAFKTATAWMH